MKVILRLLKFLEPFSKEVFLSVLAGVSTVCSGIGLLGTSAFLIASAALHPSIADLQVAIVGVRFFGISRAAFRYLERLISHSVNLHVLSRLREWFYWKIESSPPRQWFEYKKGDLLDRVLSDIETLENFYVRVVSPVITAIVIGFGVSIFIGSFSTELGIVLASGLVISGVILPIEIVLFTLITARESTQIRANLASQTIEIIQGFEDLQAFGSLEIWLKNLREENLRSSKIQKRMSILGGVNAGLSIGILNLTVFCVLWAAIPLVRESVITGINLAVIILISMASFEATVNLPQAAMTLNACVQSAKRLFAITDQNQNSENTQKITSTPSTIQFENIGFQYASDQAFLLQDVSFEWQRGQKIAVIGKSGAGKTSIVNLILKFWEPSTGRILFGDRDSNDLDVDSCRSLFGVLSQSVYLFSDTLRNNLLLGNPQASEEELTAVLKQVEMLGFVMSLPSKMDTWVGEHGQKLSGGQQQRIALARVLLQKRPYLILDEPFAHLDMHTSKLIMHAILENINQNGVLLITHDYQFLDEMDEVWELEKGRLIRT